MDTSGGAVAVEVPSAGAAGDTAMEVEPAARPERMFSLKKWNAVAMWRWDVECDTCAICRAQVMGTRGGGHMIEAFTHFLLNMQRREAILQEPYRLLRYSQHRQRVSSASAAVDVGPPCRPPHVSRQQRRLSPPHWRHLDQDIRLMRALADIMNSKRMDDRNPQFEKYRAMLRRSRVTSVGRSPSPTSLPLLPEPPPPPDHVPRRANNMRLCERQRAHSSPLASSVASSTALWPAGWLLRRSSTKPPRDADRERRSGTGGRGRPRKSDGPVGDEDKDLMMDDEMCRNESKVKRRRKKRAARLRATSTRVGSNPYQAIPENEHTSSGSSTPASPRKRLTTISKRSTRRSPGRKPAPIEHAPSEATSGREASAWPRDAWMPQHSGQLSLSMEEARRRLRSYGLVVLPETLNCRCTAIRADIPNGRTAMRAANLPAAGGYPSGAEDMAGKQVNRSGPGAVGGEGSGRDEPTCATARGDDDAAAATSDSTVEAEVALYAPAKDEVKSDSQSSFFSD